MGETKLEVALMDDNQKSEDSNATFDRWINQLNDFLKIQPPSNIQAEILTNNALSKLTLEDRQYRHEKMTSWFMMQMAQEIANINAQLHKLQNNQK